MKTNYYARILFALIIVSLGSCTIENEKRPFDQGDMWHCHLSTSWDSLSTTNHLIGTWEWAYIRCLSPVLNENARQHSGLSITFHTDHTLDVKEEGELIQSTTWEVREGLEGIFTLEVDSSVAQLHGRLLFCDDVLEFNNSYLDGCDNFFTRGL
jgi:hypothetical protein